MLTQFCMGFGYSGHIVKVNSVQESGGTLEAHVTMRLWKEDVTKAVLILDRESLMVQKAEILANSSGHETAFEISNVGVLNPEESPRLLPKSAVYKRTMITAMINGKSNPINRVSDAYSILPDKANYDLTDKQYAELTVVDKSLAYTPPKAVGKPTSRKSNTASRSLHPLFIVNLIALTIAVITWLTLKWYKRANP